MTYPKGDRGECLQHHRIRCGECEYVAELEAENKRLSGRLEELETERNIYYQSLPSLHQQVANEALIKIKGARSNE